MARERKECVCVCVFVCEGSHNLERVRTVFKLRSSSPRLFIYGSVGFIRAGCSFLVTSDHSSFCCLFVWWWWWWCNRNGSTTPTFTQ